MRQSELPRRDSLSLMRLSRLLGILAVVGFASVVNAQEPSTKPEPPRAEATATSLSDELEQLRQRVMKLSAEVTRLQAEVARLEKYRQIDYTRDLMVKEEERIRGAQKELIELGAKEIPLRKRLDEIEPQLRPDRIERSLAGVGSTKPEEDRDAISRQLSTEKRMLQAQLESIQANRPRLQSIITNAEESIVRLKKRMSELAREMNR